MDRRDFLHLTALGSLGAYALSGCAGGGGGSVSVPSARPAPSGGAPTGRVMLGIDVLAAGKAEQADDGGPFAHQGEFGGLEIPQPAMHHARQRGGGAVRDVAAGQSILAPDSDAPADASAAEATTAPAPLGVPSLLMASKTSRNSKPSGTPGMKPSQMPEESQRGNKG